MSMNSEYSFDGLTREQVVSLALLDSHDHIRNNAATNNGWSGEKVAMFDNMFPADFCAKADTWSDRELLAYVKFIHE